MSFQKNKNYFVPLELKKKAPNFVGNGILWDIASTPTEFKTSRHLLECFALHEHFVLMIINPPFSNQVKYLLRNCQFYIQIIMLIHYVYINRADQLVTYQATLLMAKGRSPATRFFCYKNRFIRTVSCNIWADFKNVFC